MSRTILLVFCTSLFILSCTSSPETTDSIDPLYSEYSGTAEDSDSADRAAVPSGIKRMKAEEIRVLVAQYEADMDEYLASGDYLAALDSFNRAADVLAGQRKQPDNADSIRQKMAQALKSVRIDVVSAPPDTVAGRAFKKNFSIKVSAVRDGTAFPIAAVPCTVDYPAYAEDGSAERRKASVKTDESGVASFTAPVPEQTGKSDLVMSLALPVRDAELAREMRDAAGQFSVSFEHSVETSRKNIPTTISFLDYNIDGKPILSSNQTATKLLRPLIQNGFSRIGMADFPRQLAAGDEEKLIAAAHAQFGSGVARFIYGTTRIVALEEVQDGSWSCTLETTLSVWDFRENRKIHDATFRHTAAGPNRASALEQARTEMSGTILVDDLRYNL